MKIFPCNEHHLAIRVIAVPENLNKNRKKTFKENNEIKKLPVIKYWIDCYTLGPRISPCQMA
jgi:hypothetical protein